MKNNNKQLEKDIKRLEKELESCTDVKKRIFLKATINVYSKNLGKEIPYKEF